MAKESDVKKRIKQWMEEYTENAEFISISDKFQHGIPDILAVISGRMAAFEVKVIRNNHTNIRNRQMLMIQKFEESGAIAGFICYYEKERRYGVFTYGEMNRKLYSLNLVPDDIPIMTANDFHRWIIFNLNEEEVSKMKLLANMRRIYNVKHK